MNGQNQIRGRVAEVLSSREVVINKGSLQGVELGMRFAILSARGQDVIDPETGEPLGSVAKPIARVQVISVQSRLAVARTFVTKQVNVGGYGFTAPKVFEPPKYKTVYETFKVEDAGWEQIDEADSIVKVGDPVEQLFEVTPTAAS